MTSIIPLSSTRISDALVSSRLLSQVRFDQSELFRIQNQLSTGVRFTLPSEDAPAALRTISLQKLLERKSQVQTNLSTNQSFLSASDAALSSVSNILAEVRGLAVSVSSNTTSRDAQAAAAQQVEQAIRQLVDVGNQQFRGRYLFAGSQTNVRPFEFFGDQVKYNGNELSLLSYADIDALFATNVTGQQVFGAISEAVRGTSDLNPVVTDRTRLADLNGGRGVTAGSITLANGTGATATVDISRAETTGDVVRLLQSANLSGSQVSAWVTSQGINVQIDQGNLTIREVAGGTTARDLGILQELGVGTAPIVGQDVNPILRSTTSLSNVLGVSSNARIAAGTPQGTFNVTANVRGQAFDGYSVSLVSGGVAGSESVVYDAVAKTIQVSIEAGASTAQTVIDAINQSAAAVDFRASLATGSNGTGAVAVSTTTTVGGTGIEFDKTSGIQIVNGGKTYTISFTSAQTINDVLNILNGSEAGVLAEINSDRTGIDIRSRLSGGDFAIGENGGQTATQLGLRSFNPSTELSSLNFGRGVAPSSSDFPQPRQFSIQRKDGTTFTVALDESLAATATVNQAGVNNALTFTALTPGGQGNELRVQIVDSGPGGASSVSLSGGLLTISADLAAGLTAQDAIDLVAANSSVASRVQAQLDTSADPGNDGSGALAAAAPVSLAGGAGPVRTIGQLLDRINTHPDNTAVGGKVLARLAVQGNGIEIYQDDLTGSGQLTILADDSTAAYDLGLLGYQQASGGPTQPGSLASVSLNGAGPNDAFTVRSREIGAAGNQFQLEIVDNPGGANTVALNGNVLTYRVDIAAGFTAQHAVNLLAANPALSAQFVAELDTTLDPANNGSGSVAASAAVPFSGGASEAILGIDANPKETKGVFTALVRLRDALLAGDLDGITRSVEVLNAADLNLNFTRADIGARQQGLDTLSVRLGNEEIELKSALSQEYEVDLVEAIINLTSRQAALEASYRTLAQISRLSLVDFL